MNRFASTNRMFSPTQSSPYGRALRVQPESGLGCPYVAFEEEEADVLGCDKCKRMRKKMRAVAEMSGRRVSLGQATCSLDPAPTGLNCQRTSTGDIICSDGKLYAKDCPNAPVVNVEGVAQDVNGAPVAPSAPGAGSTGGGSFLDDIPPLGLAAGGIAVVGILYALFKK